MSVIERAIAWAVGIAEDNSHGYDQIHRWLNPDVDCSSLVIMSFEQAGVPVKEAGATYTGNMKSAFTKCGFKALPYLKDMPLKRGDVLLNEKHHTALYLGDKKIVQASINEKGGITGGEGGDQTGKEVLVCNFYEYSRGWDYVLRYTEQEVKKVTVEIRELHQGDICPEVGLLQTLLNSLGFVGKNGKKLTVDNYYKVGGNVEYALGNYQKSKGMNPDLICGRKTWTCLFTDNYGN